MSDTDREPILLPERFMIHNGFADAAAELTLPGPRDVSGWLVNHRVNANSITYTAKEQFMTPIPFPAVDEWRQTAGYNYGDKFPKNLWWQISVDEQELPRGARFWGIDSLVRLNLLLPHKANGDTKVPLPLAVFYSNASSPDKKHGKVDWPTLTMQVGPGQISELGERLDTRASQELLLVATRILLEREKIAQPTETRMVKVLCFLKKREPRIDGPIAELKKD